MKLDPKVVEYPYERVREPRQHPDDGDGDLITLRELVSKVWRGRWTILLAALLALALAVLAVSRMDDRYRASARVMFGTPKAQVIDLQEVLADPEFGKDTLQNEIEVLRSTGLIERVVDELDLRSNPEFNQALVPQGPGWAERLRAALPPQANALLAEAARLLAPDRPAPAEATDPGLIERLTVIELVLEELELRPIEGSRVIELSFTSRDPRTSAAVVNTIADQYLVDQLEAKLQTTRSAIGWLTGRVEEARQQVQAAEEAVEALRTELAANAGQSLKLTEQQLVALNASLATARSETARKDAQYQRLTAAVANGWDMGAVSEIQDSALLRAFRAEEAALLARLDAVSRQHPAAKQIAAQLDEVRGRIRAETGSIVAAIGIDLQAARAQEVSLAASVRDLETKALAQSRAHVELRQLEREAEAGRLIYETMLNRLKETSEQVELQEANARVLSPADAPLTPESSRKLLIVAMAAVLGTFAGVTLVFLLDQINDTFRAPQQVERLTGHPVLATIPRIASRRGRRDAVRQLREKPNSSLAEAVRNLRTSILLTDADHPPKVVMFTSSVPREGKSTTSMLTALTSRQMGKSAIIVDCDLRQPSAGRTLRAVPVTAGLLSVLDGTATIDQAVHRDPHTGLHVLMSRPGAHASPENPADILASGRFRDLIRTLSERYELVVLDTPPALVVADARILSALADAVIYAVRWNDTPRGAVLDGLRELRSVNAPIAGVVLTMLNESAAAKYSFDGYVYYKGRYRDYYLN